MNRFNSIFEFSSDSRRFPAPDQILNSNEQLQALFISYENQDIVRYRNIIADVCIITNLRFPGGNASSSLDEVTFFEEQGLSVAIIHCPVDSDLGRPLSERYRPWQEKIVNWSRVGALSAKVLICRHPAVVLSHSFRQVAPKISADDAYVVVNNSYLRENGDLVYDRDALIQISKDMKVGSLSFCPISPSIREELKTAAQKAGNFVRLSTSDWTPTFNLLHYCHPPKSSMMPPYRIGRHGRDAVEKWCEDPIKLRMIYPENKDFSIRILGGAKEARKILGYFPRNWSVIEFGELEPIEYLRDLDVFVYFPHSARIEAFGRTIVEAMLAGIPVILPRAFESTFDNLPIYAEPEQIEGIVRALACDDLGRIDYLTEVQSIATARYSSPAIARRVAGTRLGLDATWGEIPEMSVKAQRFKQRIERVGLS